MGEWSTSKKRSVFYGLAGIYLLYLAYELFGNLAEVSGTEHTFCIIFSVLFAVGGVGILIFAARLFQKKEEDSSGHLDEDTEDKS